MNDLECAIECKASSRIVAAHLKGLRELAAEHTRVRRRVLVCLEPVSRRTEDGVDILGAADFLDALWGGALF